MQDPLLRRIQFLTCCASLGAILGMASPASDSAAVAGAPQEPAHPEALAFFIGEWDVEVLGPDGHVAYRARTHARSILDGHALQDDWRALNAAGEVIFRGTSLRCFIPSTGRWVIHWVMADHPGYTYLDADWIDGELHAEGHGFDGRGAFLERLRYHDIEADSYVLHIERSYDSGHTYHPTTHLRARRSTESREDVRSSVRFGRGLNPLVGLELSTLQPPQGEPREEE